MPTYTSEHVAGHQTISVPATGFVEGYGPARTPFDEPVKLPSGRTYEPNVPVGDGHERGFGWEYIKRTPGINDYDDVGKVLDTPNPVDHYGEYNIVIGDNPHGPGNIELWFLGNTLVAATESIDDYRDETVDIEYVVDKLLNNEKKQDWDHNQLGNSREEIKRNLKKILQNPDEVYEKTIEHGAAEGARSTVYLKELNIDGNSVIVMVIVGEIAGERAIATAYVPVGEAPANSDYEEVYDRKQVIENIKNSLEEGMKKLVENKELIQEYNEGDTIYGTVNR